MRYHNAGRKRQLKPWNLSWLRTCFPRTWSFFGSLVVTHLRSNSAVFVDSLSLLTQRLLILLDMISKHLFPTTRDRHRLKHFSVWAGTGWNASCRSIRGGPVFSREMVWLSESGCCPLQVKVSKGPCFFITIACRCVGPPQSCSPDGK